jgi:hypothetical protein
MTNAYMFDGDPLTCRVIVIAHDVPEAFELFWRWAEQNELDLSGLAEPIEAVLLDDLSRTPQLAEAARSGMVGIARWIDHRAPWIVAAPDDDERVGHIAPPEIGVGCFQFTGEDGTLYVVAETLERAIAASHLYSLDQTSSPAEYDTVVELSPWQLTGPLLTLREEMFEGEAGVGMKCEDGFWRIFPADYDLPVRRRDGTVR